VLADAVRNLFVLALMTGVGHAIGFRFHAGPAAALAAIGLALTIGITFSCILSAGIGGLLAAIPLIFTSSTFVPITTFPSWLETFAQVNPITLTVDALRVLCLGGPTTMPAQHALLCLAALLATTLPAAIWRYRHTTAT
jgi:ABC-type multidrug transport system permease subunit